MQTCFTGFRSACTTFPPIGHARPKASVLVLASSSDIHTTSTSLPKLVKLQRTPSLRSHAAPATVEPETAEQTDTPSSKDSIAAGAIPEGNSAAVRAAISRPLPRVVSSISGASKRWYTFSEQQQQRVKTLATSMNQCAAATVAVSVVSALVMGMEADGLEGTALASISGSALLESTAVGESSSSAQAFPTETAPALLGGSGGAKERTAAAITAIEGLDRALEDKARSAVVSAVEGLEEAEESKTTAGSVADFFRRYTVAGIARPLDGLLLAALLFYAAAPFSRAVEAGPDAALTNVFQGVQRLSLVFEQIWIASIAVVAITLLDAATVWPDIVIVTSAVFFAVAVLRSVALSWVLTSKKDAMDDVDGQLQAYKGGVVSPVGKLSAEDQPLVQRVVVGLTLGHMLQYDRQSDHHTFLWSLTRYWAREHPDEPLDCALPQYSLSQEEKQLLRVCMQSAEVAALALTAQGGASIMLCISNYVVGEQSEAVSELISASQKLLSASFVLGASHTFDAIIYTNGCDMGHLMSGIGKRGLTSLFVNLSILSVTICIANALTLLLPFIESSAVFTYAAERTSHELAHAVLELQRIIVRLL